MTYDFLVDALKKDLIEKEHIIFMLSQNLGQGDFTGRLSKIIWILRNELKVPVYHVTLRRSFKSKYKHYYTANRNLYEKALIERERFADKKSDHRSKLQKINRERKKEESNMEEELYTKWQELLARPLIKSCNSNKGVYNR